MKRPLYMLSGTVAAAFLFALLLGCAKGGSESATIDPATLKAYAPLSEVASAKEPINEEKVTLGRILFYDPRLVQEPENLL